MYPTKIRVQFFDTASQHWWTLYGIRGDEYHLCRELDRRELMALNANDVPEKLIKRISLKTLAKDFSLTRGDLDVMEKLVQ